MKFLTSLAFATALSAPAFAGGLTEPVSEPVIAPVMAPAMAHVSGEWTGFYAGAQLGYGAASTQIAGANGKGAIGGVHAGYRYDFGQFVAGAELAYNGANIDLGTTGKLDNMTQLKFMAGYDLGKTLVYGTVGATHANATLGGTSYSDTGYVFGVGMDYAINDKWTVGAEIARNKFNNFDSTGIDASGNTAQIRVGYRF